jgi:hypothetical protein
MPDDVDSHLETYCYLAGHPEVFEEIAASSGNPLRVQKALRRRYPDDAVRLALTVAELRRRAAKKFPQAERMWFDRARLEQATPWPVAVHKAARFAGPVWDYCCGLGADTLALAGRGPVTAVDRDPVACLLAEMNAEALGVSGNVTVLCRDVEGVADRAGLLHIDPDRRADAAKRAVRVEDYVPDLDALRRLMTEFRGGAVKVSPAANFGGKFDEAEIELVSLHGEAKEATVWFGALGQPDLWRATVLPQGATLAGDPLAAEPVIGPLGGYLFDPDPAVVRAGLIDLLCAETGLARLDDAEEYLTADEPIATPFATSFRVLAELPNNERAVKKHLREQRIGRLEIKARRLPIDVARLHRSLAVEGDRRGLVVFARVGGKARAVVAERFEAG